MYRGIFLYKANNNIISNNFITNNWIGIKLSYSNNNIIENNVLYDNTWMGLLLTHSSNKNKIRHNDFYSWFPIYYINAYFRNSYLNSWKENYWNDWIGLKYSILKFMPKKIPGKFNDFWPDLKPPMLEDIFHSKLTLRYNFDWHPAKEPYDTTFKSFIS